MIRDDTLLFQETNKKDDITLAICWDTLKIFGEGGLSLMPHTRKLLIRKQLNYRMN